MLAVLSPAFQLFPVIIESLQAHNPVLQTSPDTHTKAKAHAVHTFSSPLLKYASNGMTIKQQQSHTPMEAVHHLEVAPEVLLGEVIQHACVYQTLHEVRAVLRQTQAWQPLVADPLMIHVTVCQRLGRGGYNVPDMCNRITLMSRKHG